jgi:hypothetical protein
MPLLPANFNDAADIPVESVPSCWRGTAHTSEQNSQTDPVGRGARESQAPERAGVEVQTEVVEEGTSVPLVRNDFLDSSELNGFLMECRDGLEEVLLRNVRSKAFDQHDVSWEEGHDQVDCLHSLKHRSATLPSGATEACTAVAWNATGTVVAAAYGPLDRHDWRLCESLLCTWAVLRRTLDPAKADVALPLPDCLTCLAFHPENPSLLAGGAFNGDVMLWDLSLKDDQQRGKSVMDAYTHHEAIQQLAWTRHPTHGDLLCSLSAEGRLLFWSPVSRPRIEPRHASGLCSLRLPRTGPRRVCPDDAARPPEPRLQPRAARRRRTRRAARAASRQGRGLRVARLLARGPDDLCGRPGGGPAVQVRRPLLPPSYLSPSGARAHTRTYRARAGARCWPTRSAPCRWCKCSGARPSGRRVPPRC